MADKDVDEKTKKCSTCAKILPFSSFGKDKYKPLGLYSSCRKCKNMRMKQHYAKHKEQYKKTHHKYYLNNTEKVTESVRKYHKNNKETVLKAVYKYAKEHPEQRAKTYRKYLETHREKYRTNCRLRRARRKGVDENISEEAIAFIRSFWGDSCAVCGGNKKGKGRKVLPIDHWLPLSKGYPLAIDNAVVLCCTCNGKKWKRLPLEIFDSFVVNRIEKRLKEASKAFQRVAS